MRAQDMLKICHQNADLIPLGRAQVFIKEQLHLNFNKKLSLTPAQHQYLQSIYDGIISKKYGLEPMSTDKKYATGRAIAKARKKKHG